VALDRLGAALGHLLKQGQPIKGLASVLHPVVNDAEGIVLDDHTSICVAVTAADVDAGVAAVRAAVDGGLRAQAVMPLDICDDPHEVALHAANLGDAGAEAILLTVSAGVNREDLRELVDTTCEVDLVGVPMRSRLGLRITPTGGDAALELAQHAHSELSLLHFYGCIAGREAPRPSDLLAALGMRKSDFNFGSLVLAEHVPDAA